MAMLNRNEAHKHTVCAVVSCLMTTDVRQLLHMTKHSITPAPPLSHAHPTPFYSAPVHLPSTPVPTHHTPLLSPTPTSSSAPVPPRSPSHTPPPAPAPAPLHAVVLSQLYTPVMM